jgi:CheY-like chemotaxis protein
MEEAGGTLTVSLSQQILSREDLINTAEVLPGVFVQISARDDGPGIPPAILEKIFHPYFTTKETGKGSGMGLAIVHGIVKSYGGFITCNSQVDEGTVFNINLPVVEAETLAETIPVDLISFGNERILLIDDENMLAEMGKTMLERMGYSVTSQTSSIEALAAFKNQPEAFDLVITDQTMPEMTGIELAREMLETRPGMPIILCTGYSRLISEEKAKEAGIKGFALKPLTKKNLATLIREVLD